MALREAAKKRLSLGDPHQSEFSTPKSKKALLSSRMSLDAANTPRQRSDDNLVNGLRDLSHEQLIRLIMELVYAQEDGTLRKNEKLRYILSKKISDADIQPFIEKLIVLRQNIYASLVFSPNLNDEPAYNCAYIHLDAFQVYICLTSLFFEHTYIFFKVFVLIFYFDYKNLINYIYQVLFEFNQLVKD